MAEYEELRLTVTLIDNASQGLATLRQNMNALTSGDNRESLVRMGREMEGLTVRMRGVTEQMSKTSAAAQILGRSIGTAALALGSAFIGNFMLDSLRKFTDEMVRLDGTAKQIGVSSGSIKGIVDQMRAMGIDSGAATNVVTGFTAALADLGRQGSKIREELMKGAKSDPQAMAAFLSRITGFANKGEVANALNELMQAAENIFQAERARSGSDIMAAELRNRFLKSFGLDDATMAQMKGRLREMTDAEKAEHDRRMALAREFSMEWNKADVQMKEFIRGMQTALIPVIRGVTRAVGEMGEMWGKTFGDFVGDELNKFVNDMKSVIATLTAIKDWWNSKSPPGIAPHSPTSFGGGGDGGARVMNASLGSGGSVGNFQMPGGGNIPSNIAVPGTMGSGGATKGPITLGAGDDPRNKEAIIRATAAKYGIDPDTAVRVAKSEGLGTFQSSVMTKSGREKSWGAFQLFTGGGLGNDFQKETGLDPSDPANEDATIDYALKHASKHGWGKFHGAKNTGIGAFEGIGGSGGAGGVGGGVSGAMEPKGGGRGGSGYNYFQNRGDAPIRDAKQLATISTRWGQMRVHPEAAGDFKAFYDKLAEYDAPVGTSGTYNLRQKRWGGGWSSHSYAAAHDIGNQQFFTPAMKKWILDNPDKWKEAMGPNIGQPLTDLSMVGGKDPAHVEWRGPRDAATARRNLDRAMGREITSRVEGTGKLSVDIRAPRGAKVEAEGGGLFKNVEIDRQTQMEPARSGPSNDDEMINL